MKGLFAPSLRRRVVLALVLAFCLAGVVLAARQYALAADPGRLDQVVADFGRGVLAQLDTISDAAEARGAVESLEAQINRSYRQAGLPTTLDIGLWDRAGRLVHASAGAAALSADGAAGSTRVEAQGRHLHVFRGTDARWRIVVAQPAVDRGWVLRSIVSDLAVSMAIAFPFVLVPLWLAVSQGLRPLNELSRHIAGREPDDLSATGLSPRHAELRPLVRSLDGLLARLRGKVAREHAFVHDAAHELRTPLAVISAQAHALAHAHAPGEREEAGVRLGDAITRASKLVDQLLQLARLDGETGARVTTDVAAVVQEELALLEPQAFASAIELSLEAPDDLPWPIEPGAFRAILQNLVGNAIRYVQAGGHVVVALAVDGPHLRLTVTDDGPGIAAELRHGVFERFVRGPGHDVAGSGLGLAIVRQAALRLGGAVRLADGMPGPSGRPGCCFEVSL